MKPNTTSDIIIVLNWIRLDLHKISKKPRYAATWHIELESLLKTLHNEYVVPVTNADIRTHLRHTKCVWSNSNLLRLYDIYCKDFYRVWGANEKQKSETT